MIYLQDIFPKKKKRKKPQNYGKQRTTEKAVDIEQYKFNFEVNTGRIHNRVED